MASNQYFEYNAPQFVDFNADMEDNDEADTFFDVENEEPQRAEQENNPKNSNLQIKEEKLSPAKDTKPVMELHSIKEEISSPPSEASNCYNNREIRKGSRRLSSDKKIMLHTGKSFKEVSENLCDKLNSMSMRSQKRTHFEGIPLVIKEEKQHGMTTRNDTTDAEQLNHIELRSRMLVEGPSRKRKSSYRMSEVPGKYMAMAERILHFQCDTPDRFHSRKQKLSGTRSDLLKARLSYKAQKTVPLTPRLKTAFRTRPSDVVSHEDREKQEIEEIRKQQIKAVPLNEKVFQPPKPVKKSKRPATVQEPFNITEVFKKPAPKSEASPYVFTAKPVPRGLLQKTLGVAAKVELPLTVPQSPAITKPSRHHQPLLRVPTQHNDNNSISNDVYGFGVTMNKVTRPNNTEVKPFSFEERDKKMLERKETKKLQILAEEKKAREFKANPLPSFLPSKDSSTYSHASSRTSTTSLVEETHFKARSPRVLRKNPFKPILEHSHSQPLDVKLNTERRLNERRDFEVQQMMKEEKLAYEREQQALEKKRRDEEEIARIRQEAVHKARPMPKFKAPPKMPSSVLPLTEPKSPRFSSRHKSSK